MQKVHVFVKNIVKYKVLLLMMLPTTIIYIINCYLPMIGVTIAFKSIDYRLGFIKSPWIGLSNFKFLFATSDAWIIIRNTLFYNIAFIFIGIVLAVTVAIALNEITSKIPAKIYQTCIIMPNFLSMVVVSYVVYAFLDKSYGLANQFLVRVFGGEAIGWYNEPKYWPYIIVLVRMWHQVGIGSVIYLSALTGISKEYYEAAVIDGASKWQQIRNITLPLLRPVIIIIMLLSLGSIFRSDFGLFYQVPLNSGILYPVTDVIDTYVYRALINLHDVGMSSAASFYQSVVGFIMLFGTNMLIRKIDPEQALF